MHRRIRMAMLCTLGLAAAVGLAACTCLLPKVPVPATLILGEVVVVGGEGELLLSVVEMPDGGLASVAVVVGGITYDTTKISDVTVEGLYGFAVLAQQFTGGNGGFVVAHSCAGMPAGEFAKLVFKATGNVTLADFTFDKTKISLGDDDNNPVTFNMTDAYAYYTK